MKRIMMAFLSATLIGAIGIGGDLDRLQGKWSLVRFDRNRKTQTFEDGLLIIEGEHFIEKQKTASNQNIKLYYIDGAKVFEQSTEPHGQEKTIIRGIFQLENDTFRQCSIYGSKLMVPEDFSSIKGSLRSLQVWKRVGRVKGGLSKVEADTLVGIWRLDSWIFDGKRTEEEIAKSYTLAVEADGRCKIQIERTTKGIVRLDESKSPKQIDFEIH